MTLREKFLVALVAVLVAMLLSVACAPSQQEATAGVSQKEGVFNPVKIAEKGSISIFLVNGGVPCVAWHDGYAGGLSCDFDKGDILEGLRE